MGSELNGGTILWFGWNKKDFVPMYTVIEGKCDVDYDPNNMYADLQRVKDFSFSVQAKVRKGAMDYICGYDTPASMRYVRWLKRMKEKKRRSRLKYENIK